MNGITSTGFEWVIDDDLFEDMELVDMLAYVDEDPTLTSKIAFFLCGKEQKKALYEHCRNEKGRIPATAVMAELEDIVKHKSKNS